MNRFGSHPNIEKSDKVKCLQIIGDEKVYIFKPTLLRLFPVSGDTRKMDVKQKARFLLMYFSGYHVYLLTTLDDTVKCTMTFTRGGSFRYPFTTKKDLIDGPSFTVPAFRRQGAAVRLGDFIMNHYEKNYEVIYATIKNDNTPSLGRVKKNGFDVIGHVTYNNKWHRAVIDDNGESTLVAYRKKTK